MAKFAFVVAVIVVKNQLILFIVVKKSKPVTLKNKSSHTHLTNLAYFFHVVWFPFFQIKCAPRVDGSSALFRLLLTMFLEWWGAELSEYIKKIIVGHSVLDLGFSLEDEMAGPYRYGGGHTRMVPTEPGATNHQTSQFELVWPPPYRYGGGHTGSKMKPVWPS